MADSAVVVVVPPAEPVVGAWRGRLDEVAAWGVPAHVTVLFPFLPVEQIDAEVLKKLAEAAATVPAFDVTFAATAWFGEETLYLAPAPADPFVALTKAVWERFPQCPPYGGAYDTVTPHLTVGHEAPYAELRIAERDIEPKLPVRAPVTHLTLLTGPDWIAAETFALGRSPARSSPETG